MVRRSICPHILVSLHSEFELENDARFLLGQASVARLLIDNGALLNVKDKRYPTPISLPSTPEGIFQLPNVFYSSRFYLVFDILFGFAQIMRM